MTRTRKICCSHLIKEDILNIRMLLSMLVLLLVRNCISASLSSTRVTIDDNGYKGIVIAIHPDVSESADLIEAIKETWTSASKDLYIATGKRAYFKQITILLPKTWNEGNYDDPKDGDNYDQADVIVAPANPAYGNEPYTIHYQGCRKPGIRTHFTPSYMLDERYVDSYGPRGKVVVHEWAHYRWGIFDETSMENPFYWDPVYGDFNGPTPTQCPRDIVGEIINVNDENGAHCTMQYDFNKTSDSYFDYCVFFTFEENNDNFNASIMSYQYMDNIVTFCKDEGETDSNNAHNIYAPNLQNTMCSFQSTWSIIRESPDIKSRSIHNITDLSDVIPVFTVVKKLNGTKYVLVLDDSGSMGTADCDGIERFNCLKKAAVQFINMVPNNSYVGIVKFGTRAFKLNELTLVTSNQERVELLQSIEFLDGGSGSTSIGSGITSGIEILEKGEHVATGAYMLVITDGDENQMPFVSDVASNVTDKSIFLDTIFIVNENNQALQNLTEKSNGKQFFVKSQSDLLLTFSQLVATDSTDNNAYQIHSDSFTVPAGDSHRGSVSIDQTIGLNTLFSFTWAYGYSAPDIRILSPLGCYYSNSAILNAAALCSDSTYESNPDFKTIYFEIPGVAEVGEWVYTVKGGTYDIGSVSSFVTSNKRSDSTEPIIIESGLGKTEIEDGGAAVVYAKISQGYNPILGAIVKATVKGSRSSPKTISLYDNGAGCDIIKNDGVYSRYFTQFTGSGRYSVKIDVTNGTINQDSSKVAGSSANYKPGTIAADGTVNFNSNGAISNEGGQSADVGIQSQDLGQFTRVVPSESFDYTGTVNVDAPGAIFSDNFSPAKIIDLRMRQNDLEDYSRGIVIQFTATGNDFDQGQAYGYDIRYTFDDPTTLVSDFDASSKISQSDMLKGNLSNPSPSGEVEEFIVQTPNLPVDATGSVVNNSRLAFSVKAYDSSGNYGQPSNVPVINFFITPLILPTAKPTIQTSTFTRYQMIYETNDELLRWLSAGFALTTAIFLTSTLIVSIWLCKTLQRSNKVNGLDDLEMNQSQKAIRKPIEVWN